MNSASPAASGPAQPVMSAALTPGPSRPTRRRTEIWRNIPRVMLEPRSRKAWAGAVRQVSYVVIGLLVAIPGFLIVAAGLIAGLGLSFSFAGMLIGLPVLAVTLLAARWFGAVYRGLARRLLGVVVEDPPEPVPLPGRLGRMRAVLTDPAGWRACAYLAVKLPLALLTMIIASYVLIYGIPYLTFPVWWALVHSTHTVLQPPGWLLWWKPDPLVVVGDVHSLVLSFSLIPVGVLALLWAPWATKGSNSFDGRLIARLLGPPLSDRVRELEQTRARAVDDAAARLRRIERDLHDGAQAQMVAVAMKLGLARDKLPGPGRAVSAADLERAAELVEGAHRSAKEAITELRDLARGIHPPVLDHGLGTALATLAARSEVPVELVIDLPERPSAAIETIAYFCAAELLTNIAKHSGARHATLEAVHAAGAVRVRAADDGRGGARAGDRGGLAGLAERAATVDGTMVITSPPGGPTVVTVELPSRA